MAWLGPNHPAFLESLFAAGLLGAVLAPLNHRLPDDEVLGVMEDAEPTVLIAHRRKLPRIAPSVRHRVEVSDDAASDLPYEAVLVESLEDDFEEDVGPNDLFMLPHTSGTTGRPKGVMLTHGNVTWNVVNFLSCADFRSGDVTVAIAPFFRVGGTGVNVLPVLFLEERSWYRQTPPRKRSCGRWNGTASPWASETRTSWTRWCGRIAGRRRTWPAYGSS